MNSLADIYDERAARILAFLDAHHVMSLATCGTGGPHAANLFYAHHDFTLLWVSDPASEHSIHVEGRARVAATIATDYSDFAEIRGLQILGDAYRICDESERKAAGSYLEARFAFLCELKSAPARLREVYDRAQYYRLVPMRIALIDNTRGFGFKEVIDLTAEQR